MVNGTVSSPEAVLIALEYDATGLTASLGSTSLSISPDYILDSYSSIYSSLTGAYSVRRLFSIYTDAHVRIKRSSDNAEVDVTFDYLGNVEIPSDWTTWSGSDTLYVTKWYDQSGNNKFGTAVNSPTYDKTNKRVVFGSTSYFTLPNGVATLSRPRLHGSSARLYGRTTK